MTKCIICKKTPQGSNVLTDEHIFPEFIGGNLKKKNVCSSCNSNMGADFEGRLENGFLFSLFSYQAKVVKKSGLAKSPFVGDYKAGGKTFEVDEDFNYKLKFTGFEESRSSDGSTSFSMSIDEEDFGRAESLIVKKLARRLKKQGKNVDENKLRMHVNNLIEDGYKVESLKPELQRRFYIDRRFLSDLKLLALKVMFESMHYFGCIPNDSKVLKKSRASLQKKNIDPFLEDKVFICDKDDFFVEKYLPLYTSYMICLGGYCYLKIADWYLLIILDYEIPSLYFILANLKEGDVSGDVIELINFLRGDYLKKFEYSYMPPKFHD
ncbi:HNH endonuclease [Halomonas sp. CUBES01]|uniref:HNH endonuclease n=1 Tax=Halomonas sp. CUBES01 TaxID=2897340 RepID=UPI001E3D1195|nr:HNH endonuclease [Halomonas sp. CUBES01]MEC4767955.1 HNH endonuclease [Halomonas sp. CUBES01]